LTRSTPQWRSVSRLGVVSRMVEKIGQAAQKLGENADRGIVHRDGHCCDPLGVARTLVAVERPASPEIDHLSGPKLV
jgi:hypothetical protein